MKKKTNIFLSIFALACILASCAEEVATTPETSEPAPTSEPVVAQATSTPTPKPSVSPTIKKTTTKKKTVAGASVAPTATPVVASVESTLPIEKKIVAKVQKAYDALQNYSATISFFSKKNEKRLPDAKPLLNAKFKYMFQTPRMESFDVLEHSISMIVGGKIVWKGEKKVVGKVGILSLSVDLTDSKVTTNRDWNFGQMDHVALLERLNSSKGELSLAGKSTVGGTDVYILKIKGPVMDEDVTEESIAIDTKTFLMVSDEVYVGSDMVFQLKINVDGTNINVPAGTFDV